jgi:predicted Fe-S protein YdhL (DUF1289 family)
VSDLPSNPEPIPSPCVGFCCVGADGLCIGCYRSVAELSRWVRAPGAERLEILRRCRTRQAEAEAEELRGGSVAG